MRPRIPATLLAILFTLSAAADPLLGQAVTPPDNQPSAPHEDKIIVLSPFVVNASQDTGYQATSTLAGTRLNTPVKDLGASISIYTKDFINDIGATSSSDLLIYATGMEAAGAGGNFSGATSDINAVQFNGNAPRVNPQSSSRTRGLSAPNFTRGFFTTDIATDGYNVESVTVNRGPNSILFGVGSPAGVVESSLLRPILSRNRNQVEVRVGGLTVDALDRTALIIMASQMGKPIRKKSITMADLRQHVQSLVDGISVTDVEDETPEDDDEPEE